MNEKNNSDPFFELDEAMNKLSPEERNRIIKEAVNSIPKHTGNKISVGGIRPSCLSHPDYWKHPRKVWCCPKDCPACEKDRIR